MCPSQSKLKLSNALKTKSHQKTRIKKNISKISIGRACNLWPSKSIDLCNYKTKSLFLLIVGQILSRMKRKEWDSRQSGFWFRDSDETSKVHPLSMSSSGCNYNISRHTKNIRQKKYFFRFLLSQADLSYIVEMRCSTYPDIFFCFCFKLND